MVEQSEIWMPVTLFDGSFFGIYEVSDLGRVRRCGGSGGRAPASRVLTPSANWGGYMQVSLSSSARSEHPAVHRLVADAFLGPRPAGLQVHHCNGIKEDNRACNLTYVTASENCSHRSKTLGKGRGEEHYRCKFSDADIETVRTLYTQGVSQKKIAAQFNVRQSWVSAVVNNQTRCPLGEEAKFPGREKLTVQQVREIKTKATHGATQLILAAEYKVSPSEVGRIVRGDRWAHLHL